MASDTNDGNGEDVENLLREWYYSSDFAKLCTVARASGILSMLGAIYIILDIGISADRRKIVKNRIIFLMSVCDFIYSLLRPVIGTALFPRYVDAPGAIGTQLTCTLQGFFSFSALYMSINFNMMLALCYVLMIIFNYSEDAMKHWLQPLLIFAPVLVGLSITTPALLVQGFNPSGSFGCEFANWPPVCATVLYSDKECERGFASGARPWDDIYFFQVLVALVVVIASKLCLYVHIRRMDRERIREGIPGRNLARAMRIQGVWFCGVFVLAFLPYTIKERFYDFSTAWHYVVSCSVNLIGFLNALVFIRPRIAKFQRDYPEESLLSSWRHTIFRTTPRRFLNRIDGFTGNGTSAQSTSQQLRVDRISSSGSFSENSSDQVTDSESLVSSKLFPVILNELEEDSNGMDWRGGEGGVEDDTSNNVVDDSRNHQ